MKKIFTSMFALATLLTANAQMADGVQARVYAYDLQQEQSLLDDGVNTYAITFKTNCAANEGKVILLQDGEAVYEVAATSTDGKNWTAKVDVYALQESGFSPEAGTYNWSVEVSAPAVESSGLTLISDNYNSDKFSFLRPYNVAVDKSPESDNFGSVYVTNSKAGNTTYSDVNRTGTQVGIYSFQPTLEVENEGNVHSCSIVGDYAASGDAPSDMVVGADGLIYVTISSKNAKIGLYTVDPSNNFSYERILDGSVDTEGTPATDETEAVNPTYYTLDGSGNVIVGLPFGVGVYGSGDKRELYVLNGQAEYAKYSMTGVSRYAIGKNETWSSVADAYVFMFSYNSKSVRIYNNKCAIEPISTGGYWISYYYSNSTGSTVYAPSLIYCNKNNICQFTFEGANLVSSNGGNRGGLAVDDSRGVVAYSDGKNATFLNYTTNDDNTISVDTESLQQIEKTGQGSRSCSLDFDYAGNLYAVTDGNEKLSVFAVPDAIMGENKRVTPAKSNLLVSLTDQDITTGIVEIGVDADAAVEYYNLQGVKVANPSNGIFIKKQGNKTTKVVL